MLFPPSPLQLDFEAKKTPILIPAHLQQNTRAQSMENLVSDNIPPASSAITLPGSTKVVHYRLKATPSAPTPQAVPLGATNTNATSPPTSPSNWPGQEPGHEKSLVRELEYGMRSWDRKISQASQRTSEDDSGYIENSWKTTLPTATISGENNNQFYFNDLK